MTKIELAETPEKGNLKVEFAYDHQGRRVEKVVSTWQSEDWTVGRSTICGSPFPAARGIGST
ncbi:MAG: hypothetical protein KKB50_17990 [Planctomycetes bacterium]|nr:hypothetical protein [Planctomycetota bacterium]